MLHCESKEKMSLDVLLAELSIMYEHRRVNDKEIREILHVLKLIKFWDIEIDEPLSNDPFLIQEHREALSDPERVKKAVAALHKPKQSKSQGNVEYLEGPLINILEELNALNKYSVLARMDSIEKSMSTVGVNGLPGVSTRRYLTFQAGCLVEIKYQLILSLDRCR